MIHTIKVGICGHYVTKMTKHDIFSVSVMLEAGILRKTVETK